MNWKPFILPILVCSFFLLASAVGIVWYASNPLLRGDIDGLLLLAISGLTGTIFFAQLFSIVRISLRAMTVGVPWKQAIGVTIAELRTALLTRYNQEFASVQRGWWKRLKKPV
jgi:hypothetical protein